LRGRKARKASGDPPADRRSFSFRSGLGALPQAMARTLGEAVHLSAPVRSVRREADRWQIEADGAAGDYDAVVCTLPLHRLPALDFAPGWDRAPLQANHYAPVTVLALGYRREAIGHALDGFGVLVPKREPFRILGALFSSTLFPGRAPEHHALLTCFLGGQRHPADAALPTSELLEIARRDLDLLLDAVGQPTLILEQRWPRAIPQYGLGYTAVLDALDAAERELPAFRFAGNFRGGIALGDAVTSGRHAAEAVLEALA
jgi:oxygen-dependent protoporphyrinogen oxidase